MCLHIKSSKPIERLGFTTPHKVVNTITITTSSNINTITITNTRNPAISHTSWVAGNLGQPDERIGIIERGYNMFFKNIDEIVKLNKRTDHHFFDKDAMRVFRSIIDPRIYHGMYFITSENDGSNPRYYTIRRANSDGSITDITPDNEIGYRFSTKDKALRYLEKFYQENWQTEQAAQERSEEI